MQYQVALQFFAESLQGKIVYCHDLRWECRNKDIMVTNTSGNVRNKDVRQREGPSWGAIPFLLTI